MGVRPKFGLARFIWSTVALPKHIFVLWLAAKGRLMTLDRLNRWSKDYDRGICCLCNIDEESPSHLFFQCGYSRITLDDICRWLQLHHVPYTYNDLHHCASHMSSKHTWKQQVWSAWFAAMVHHLWAERNSRRHGSSSLTAMQRFQLLRRESLVRVEGHKRKLTTTKRNFLQCLNFEAVDWVFSSLVYLIIIMLL